MPADADEFLQVMEHSRSFHSPWVFPPRDVDEYRRYLARLQREEEAGFLVRGLADDDLLGVVNLSVITRGALLGAYLGYYASRAAAGRGYMKEGLSLVIGHAFGELGLHRLEANIQPGNQRSIDLVRGLGFRREGFSERFLFINGAWRDHERWALLSDQDQY